MENRNKWYKEIIAFAEGKQIQSKRPSVLDKWQDDDFPMWNDPDTKFRVKPGPKYTPLTFGDRDGLRGKWVKRKDSGSEGVIYHMSKTHINKYTWEQALEILEFLDGTPFGKLVEEGGDK